jgi:uncharacterized membrane protein
MTQLATPKGIRAKFFSNPIHKYFFWIALIYGLLFVVITPPFCVHDEDTHMFRIYQLSQGYATPQKFVTGLGGDIPQSLAGQGSKYRFNFFFREKRIHWSNFVEDFKQPLNASKTVQLNFANTALNAPISYAPQVAVVAVARQLNTPPLVMLYLARLAAFVTWLFLVCWGLYLMPRKKLFLAIALLLPMSLFVAGSTSADAVTNGLFVLTLGFIVRCLVKTERFAVTEGLTIAILGILLALCKQPYWLIIFLALAIPTARFRNWKVAAVVKLALILGAGIIAKQWIDFTSQRFYPYRTDFVVDPDKQMHEVVHHPLNFTKVLARTYATSYGDKLPREMIGVLGSERSRLPLWLSYTAYGLLGFSAAVADKVRTKLTHKVKGYIGLLAAGIVGAVSLIIYNGWSMFRESHIEGLQGRYFLPILFMLAPLLFGVQLIKGETDKHTKVAFGLACFLLVAALACHLQYNYFILG